MCYKHLQQTWTSLFFKNCILHFNHHVYQHNNKTFLKIIYICNYKSTYIFISPNHAALKAQFTQKIFFFFIIYSMLFQYEFFLVESKRGYFEECVKPNGCWSPLTSIVWGGGLWKSMATIICLVTNILHNIFLCVQQKKEIHAGL